MILWGALRLVAGAVTGGSLALLALGLPWFFWPDDSAELLTADRLVLAAVLSAAAVGGVLFATRPFRSWWQLWATTAAGAVAGAGLGLRLRSMLEPGGPELAGLASDALIVPAYGAAGCFLGFVAFLLGVARGGRPDGTEAAEAGREPPADASTLGPVPPAPAIDEGSTDELSTPPPPLPSLDELQVGNRRVLVRCDLNVPLENGEITDDMRIRASLPTLRELLDRGARVAVCSHLGRPKGKVVEELRMAPVAARLGDLLGRGVTALEEVTGDRATEACASDDAVVVIENLRFDPGEESNSPEFAGALAGLAGAYVNDAFGSSHRAHASVVGVPERLPAAAGLLLTDEVQKLGALLHEPQRPFVVVLGGAKVSDKLGVIDNLLGRVDEIVIGGAMAFTLLKARGVDVGRSRVEEDRVDEVKDVLGRAERAGIDILLPTDVVAADALEEGAAHETVPLEEIGERMGVDIGFVTAHAFAGVITKAKTVLWNGPMGIFEIDAFSEGTRMIARAVGEATAGDAFTVVGGGDSAAALRELGMTGAVSHISTGGGASLEFLEGKDLPGVAALRKRKGSGR